ncbi:MAG: lysophospholipid acyltransferase family protein [Methylophilaceae bacterium]|nr:lysophospholipid acyltransferase family protein [Methylophilaceae bacterium]
MKPCLIWWLRLLARLPLPLLHFFGCIAGWLMFVGSRRTARRMIDNLRKSGLCPTPQTLRSMLIRNIHETGKAMLEALAIWFRPPDEVLRWVRACHGWEWVERALHDGRGIIFLTPHLGCFEITALYYAAHHPISVLYRPPRKSWLAPLLDAGRTRSRIELAPTSLQGVRRLLESLRRGEAIGILPDQVPSAGEGEWVQFFGQPAYTMTLVGRLAQSTGATVLMAAGERLAGGKGYVIHIEPMPDVASPIELNRAIERWVRRFPAQYFWCYARYKKPRGAPPRPNE